MLRRRANNFEFIKSHRLLVHFLLLTLKLRQQLNISVLARTNNMFCAGFLYISAFAEKGSEIKRTSFFRAYR